MIASNSATYSKGRTRLRAIDIPNRNLPGASQKRKATQPNVQIIKHKGILGYDIVPFGKQQWHIIFCDDTQNAGYNIYQLQKKSRIQKYGPRG